MNNPEHNKSLDLSIVIPAFNECANLPSLTKKIHNVLSELNISYEILFVDDGSSDLTLKCLEKLSQEYLEVGYLSLSQNYGHQIALLTGLKESKGHVAISMDADFQHPPEVLPFLYQQWLKTSPDVIQTRRQDTLKQQSSLKNFLSTFFYKMMNIIFRSDLVEGGADFRLMGPKLINDLRSSKRTSIFLRGFCAKSCYKSYILDFEVDLRLYGDPKYTLKKQIELALQGISEFTHNKRFWKRIKQEIHISRKHKSQASMRIAVK